MKTKTIDEEIPITTEGLRIYKKELEKELAKYAPVVRRLENVLKQVNKHLERMSK